MGHPPAPRIPDKKRDKLETCPRKASFPVNTQSGRNRDCALAKAQDLGELVGAPSSERVWHRLCSSHGSGRAGPAFPFQQDEAQLVPLPDPSPPSLLVTDLHLSFGQLVSSTERALLGSPPSDGSVRVPPSKGSIWVPPRAPCGVPPSFPSNCYVKIPRTCFCKELKEGEEGIVFVSVSPSL